MENNRNEIITGLVHVSYKLGPDSGLSGQALANVCRRFGNTNPTRSTGGWRARGNGAIVAP